MKKTFLSFLLLTSLLTSLHSGQSFSSNNTAIVYSINDKTDQPALDGLIDIIKKSSVIYLKHNKISPEWIALGSEFQQKINDLKKDGQTIEIVPHSNIFNLPVINLDKDKETDFKNALAKIEPITKTVYYYDAPLVKKALYALIHHHFVVIKQNEKYFIIFGTNCKNEAKKSALDSTKTLNAFVDKMSRWLKARLAVLTATS
jgi:hypothetical protein